ncbi:Mitochondrial amidoxime reducing component 2 [Actinomortierella ambigua]|nr:Mitochondrial amidoxime reducing component 2 [Actinomortierella ambigua]
MLPTPIVSKILIYPIKSCKPIFLQETSLTRLRSSLDDRQRVDDDLGVSARAAKGIEQSDIRDAVANMTEATLIIPLELRSDRYSKTQVHMFGKHLEGLDLDDQAATFFSDFLDFSCRLIHKSPDEMAFADQFPILALSEESIQDINSHLDDPVSVVNFRANLIIQGYGQPFEEDKWREVDIAGITFYFTCRCPRCSMPNINVDTAVKDKIQPRRTPQSIRRVDQGKMARYKACVGMNVVPSKTSGTVRVGHALIVKSAYQGERLRAGEER